MKSAEPVKSDIDTAEMDRFTAKVRDTKNLQKDIKERINEIKDGLGTQLEERIKLENNLEEFPRWVQSKESEVACPSLLPLKSEATDKIRHKYLKIDEELRSFCNVNITGIRRRAEHLMKDCDEEEADELDEEVNGIIASVSDLSQTLNETIANVTKSIKLKNSFELQVDTATKWISKAESSSQVDPKNLQSNEILSEHLESLEELELEIEEYNLLFKDIGEIVQELQENLSDADSHSIEEIQSALTNKFKLIQTNLGNKTKQIREIICTSQKMTEHMVKYTQTLADLQKEARALGRPVGRSIEEAQQLLQCYHTIMKKVSDFRKTFEEKRKSVSTEEMRNLIHQQQELMSILEKQILRIKSLISVRQQYFSLTGDITTFINEQKPIIKNLETDKSDTLNKTKNLNAVLNKIQESEAQLALAQDKGSFIGDEGKVEDRNIIMEELQKLRLELFSLRSGVEKMLGESEVCDQDHRRIQIELNTTMEWLFEQESELKSRPLLTIDVGSADDEIEAHQELGTDIDEQLVSIRSILDRCNDLTATPYALQERMSEANMILSSFPIEIKSRLQYLSEAKLLRIEFNKLKTELQEWITKARQRPDNCEVNFINATSELDNHNNFFINQKSVGETLQKISETAEKIVPSLGSDDQDGLSKTLQEITDSIEEINKQAKLRKEKLKKNLKAYADYKSALDQCRTLIHNAGQNLPKENFSVSLGSLRSIHQRIDEERNRLYNQDYIIQSFIEKASTLTQKSDENGQAQIGQEMVGISKKWKSELEKIDMRKIKAQQVIELRQKFELSLRSLEAGLLALEDRLKDVESKSLTTKDKDELEEEVDVSFS